MKKIFSILLTLVLVLSFSLMTAVPVAAEEPGILLSATGAIGTSNADTIVVEVPAGTTLGDITSIAWSEYLIEGYPPHVDIMLDLIVDGTADEALVFEYALNGHTGDSQPTYGALTGAWYQTFSDDGNGPAVIDDDALAWLATGPPGGPDIILGTLADWKAGTVDSSVNSSALVLCLEIEVDNYITDCVALVDNIEVVLTSGAITLEATINLVPDIVAISVSPTSIDFGDLNPGSTSAETTITVTNTGSVAVDVSTSVSGAFFIANLWLDAALAAEYTDGPLAPTGTLTPAATVQVPSDQPAGAVTGSITFEVVATP